MRSPLELWHLFIECYDVNFYRGGWHRVVVVGGTALAIYAAVISWMYFSERKK